jgi:hypothetical protein
VTRIGDAIHILKVLIGDYKKYGCFYKEKLHSNGFCPFCFLGFARRIFYPALFTLLYFIILVVAISF